MDRLDEVIGPHLEKLRSELASLLRPASVRYGTEAEKISQSLKAPIAQLAATMEALPVLDVGVPGGCDRHRPAGA